MLNYVQAINARMGTLCAQNITDHSVQGARDSLEQGNFHFLQPYFRDFLLEILDIDLPNEGENARRRSLQLNEPAAPVVVKEIRGEVKNFPSERYESLVVSQRKYFKARVPQKSANNIDTFMKQSA